jgi:hypothetical protein
MRSDSREGDDHDRRSTQPASQRQQDSRSGEGAASAMAHMKRQRRQQRRQAGSLAPEHGPREHGS